MWGCFQGMSSSMQAIWVPRIMCGARFIPAARCLGRRTASGSANRSGIDIMAVRFLAAALGLALFSAASGASGATTPCGAIDRALPAEEPAVARAVASQMGVQKVKILESFREGNWRILYVNNDVADEAFLFYPGDPTVRRYVTLWAGAAMPTEEASILRWTETNAVGIPPPLAECFAWHVTQDRDQ